MLKLPNLLRPELCKGNNMGDTVENFKAMKEFSRKQRAKRRKTAPQALTEIGIKFQSKNNEAHLIIDNNGERIDFWPGTGLWMIKGRRKRGFDPLMTYLQTKTKTEEYLHDLNTHFASL